MKLFKRLYEYIINLFIKKEDREKIESNVDEVKEVTSEDLFSDIEVGDIIWAKRYSNEEEKEIIKEGHREGPYIVIVKNNNTIKAIYGSSTDPKNYIYKYYKIELAHHGLRKNTYFRFFDIDDITKDRYIDKIDSLDKREINDIFKQIKKFNKQDEELCSEIMLQESEIIEYENKKYLILDKKEEKLTCLLIDKIYLDSLDDIKKIDYSKVKVLNSKDCKYIKLLDNEYFIRILKKYKDYLEFISKQKIPQRGSIIKIEDELYYIYGEDGQNWLVFRIFENKINHYKKITINNKIYYTNYKDEAINKKYASDAVMLANEGNINLIKEERKNYKEKQLILEQRFKRRNNSNQRYFKLGNVVKYKNKDYIIIKIDNKLCVCLALDDIRNAIHKPYTFTKKEIKISNNYIFEGIKFFEYRREFDLEKIGKEKYLNQMFNEQKRYIKQYLLDLRNEIEGKILENYDSKNKPAEKFEDKIIVDEPKFRDINLSHEDKVQIKIGDTVMYKDSEFFKDEYIVKDILGNIACCVKASEFSSVHAKASYFDKNQLIVVKNKQKKK